MQFQLVLRNESWESVYESKDTNKFKSFLYTFLNMYEASFPTKYKNTGKVKKCMDNTRN
jgi:hypothetical protein